MEQIVKKNRYFKGKQLQSEDFTLEQEYVENLHRKSNAFLFGKGILQGLSLQPYNEQQFQLSSGCAIDGYGNILYVEKDVPIFLQQIEGFDSLEDQQAHIYLTYQENQIDPSFCSLSEKEDHLENNHIQCSWKLCIQKEHEQEYIAFFENYVVYEDKDVIVTQRVPSLLPAKGQVSMIVEVRKKRALRTFELSYEILIPDFEDEQLSIKCKANDVLQHVEVFHFSLKRKANYGNTRSMIQIQGDVSITKNEKKKNVKLSYEHYFPISKDFLNDVKERVLAQKIAPSSSGVYLGSVELEVEKRAWKISDIKNISIHEYVPPMHLQVLQEQLLTHYHYQPPLKQTTAVPIAKEFALHSGEVSRKEMKKQGDIYISKELSHGFGPMHVEVNVMLKIQEQHQSEKATYVYQGDFDALHNHKKHVLLGVKISLEAGSFQIMLKDENLIPYTSIVWTARSFKLDQPQEEQHLMSLMPTMIELSPLASCVFTPVFDCDEHICECNFSLLNHESGTIREDGVYYAPATEGVYQIQVSSVQGESAYAYAYVKEKA